MHCYNITAQEKYKWQEPFNWHIGLEFDTQMILPIRQEFLLHRESLIYTLWTIQWTLPVLFLLLIPFIFRMVCSQKYGQSFRGCPRIWVQNVGVYKGSHHASYQWPNPENLRKKNNQCIFYNYISNKITRWPTLNLIRLELFSSCDSAIVM